MSCLALFLLGQPRIERDGKAIRVPLQKATALLSYLATTGERHSREELAALFWPEHERGAALNTLRVSLHALKKALGTGLLAADRQAVSLSSTPDLWVDVHHFHSLLAECQTHRHPANRVCAACLSPLTEAVQLYRGDFLAGFALPDSAPFDDWQRLQAEATRREVIDALEKLAHCYSAQGKLDQAISHAQRWLALDPLQESAHRLLMRLYASTNQRQAALRQYDGCAQLLAEELGELPDERTSQLYRAIKENQLPLQEAIAQLSLLAPRPFVASAHAIPFVGRVRELAEVARLLHEPNCRLLTLTGPGGIGKTRLALQAASENAEAFPDGVWLVSLAAVSSPELLAPAIVKVLGLSLHGGTDLKAQLLSHLCAREALLILDNMEHLVEGAALLTDILSRAPGIKMLVTSRERLNVQWEWLFQVQGLEFPADGAADIEEYSAVQLFLQSARRAHCGFAPSEEDRPSIVRICRFLNGMPLGIELAAAWTQVLSCEEIAEEIERSLDFLSASMRDMPERHGSLRAVFDHSWSLLSDEERGAFARLSVFRGGFRRQAAEQVGGAGLSHLSALTQKSLLHRSVAGRYEMLEILRQYAAERLRERPQEWEEAQHRHGEYYAAFLHDREAYLKGLRQPEALEEVAEEIENVRAAWQWAVAHGSLQEIDRAQESLYLFYNIRNWFQEGAEAFGEAVERLRPVGEDGGSPTQEETIVLGRLLSREGYFCDRLWQFGKAQELLQASLAIFRRLGMRGEIALALRSLARVALDTEDYAEARQLFQASLVVCQETGDRWGAARCLNLLGYIAMRTEEYHQARRLLQQGVLISQDAGDQWGMAYCLSDLGSVALALEEHQEAEQLLEESLAIYKGIGDRQGEATALGCMGLVAVGMGEHHKAREAYLQSIAICREIGYQQEMAHTSADLGLVLYILGEHEAACAYLEQALATALDAQSVFAAVKALVGMVTLLVARGKKGAASSLVAQVLCRPALQGKVKDSMERAASSVGAGLLVYARHSPAAHAEFVSAVQEIKDWAEQSVGDGHGQCAHAADPATPPDSAAV